MIGHSIVLIFLLGCGICDGFVNRLAPATTEDPDSPDISSEEGTEPNELYADDTNSTGNGTYKWGHHLPGLPYQCTYYCMQEYTLMPRCCDDLQMASSPMCPTPRRNCYNPYMNRAGRPTPCQNDMQCYPNYCCFDACLPYRTCKPPHIHGGGSLHGGGFNGGGSFGRPFF